MRSQLTVALVAMLILTACTIQPVVAPAEDAGAVQAEAASGDITVSSLQHQTEESVPRFEPADCKYDVLADLDPECGYLVVPEDRADPNSPTIRVYVIKIPASTGSPASDPVVLIPGGPGGSGTFFAWLLGASPMSEAMRTDRVLYILEARGAMYSDPAFYCPETEMDWTPLVEMTMAEAAGMRLEQLRACHDRLVSDGRNLSAYGYLDIAQDVVDLGAVLDIEAMNIYGVSAGTPAAMLAMAVNPEGIRSVILDSVFPPESNLVSHLAEQMQAALDNALAACDADATCAEAYPDLEGALSAVLDQLRAEPVIVEVEHESGQTFAVAVDDVKFVHSLYDTIFIGEGFANIPAAIYTAYGGDLQAVAEGWVGFVASQHGQVSAEEGSGAEGMHFAAQCLAEGSHTDMAGAVAANLESEALPSIQRWSVDSLLRYMGPCDYWDVVLPASRVAIQPVESELPVLMLSGIFDPEAQPSLSRDATDLLPNSFFYKLPAGHGLVFTECGIDLMVQFLADPNSAPDAGCIDNMAPAWVFSD